MMIIDPDKIAQDIYNEMQPKPISLIDPEQIATEIHQDLQTPTESTQKFQFGGGETRGAGAVSQEDFEAPESKAKDIADAFYLSARDMWHRSKQYFTSALPNLVFKDINTTKKINVDGNEFVMDGMWIGTKEQAKRKNEGLFHLRKEFKKIYNSQEDKYKEWIKANPELQPRKGWDKGVIETVKKNPKILLDPAYWGYVAAKSAAFTMGVMGTTVGVTALTKNPYAGLAAGVALATPMQSQDLYEDLIDNRATEEQAAKLAVPIGTLIASVEVAGDLPFLRTLSAPIRQMLTRQTGKQVAKLTMRQIAKKGLKTFGAVQIAETLEEVAQTAIQNATVKTINENRSILEDIPETIVQTLIATTPFGLVGGGAEVRTQLRERIKGTSLDVEMPKPPRIVPSLGIEEITPTKPIITPTPTKSPTEPVRAVKGAVKPTKAPIEIVKTSNNILNKVRQILGDDVKTLGDSYGKNMSSGKKLKEINESYNLGLDLRGVDDKKPVLLIRDDLGVKEAQIITHEKRHSEWRLRTEDDKIKVILSVFQQSKQQNPTGKILREAISIYTDELGITNKARIVDELIAEGVIDKNGNLQPTNKWLAGSTTETPIISAKPTPTKPISKELEPLAKENIFSKKPPQSLANLFDERDIGVRGYKTIKEYQAKAKGKEGVIIQMTPDEYLSKIAPSSLQKEKTLALKEKVDKGVKLTMPSLAYDKTGYDTQEGRHRAFLAKEMGIEKIPVAIEYPTGNPPEWIKATAKVEKPAEVVRKKPISRELVKAVSEAEKATEKVLKKKYETGIKEFKEGVEVLRKEEKKESKAVVEDILKGAEEFRKGAALIAREQEREFRIKRQKLLQTERTKYQEKMADIKERMQKQGLKEALRKEAMGARRAYVVGKREGIQKLREHYKEVQERGRERIKAGREIRVMVAQIKRLNVQALPVEYQDQINTIRDSLYLKRMTEKKALKIENMREFVERQKELGEPILIPEKQLDLLDKTPLNKMTIEEFKDAHSALMRVAYQGKLKNKLIAGKELRDLNATATELSQSVVNIAKARKRFKPKIEIEGRVKTPSERRRKGFDKIKNTIDSTLSNLRKWDSITEEADGFRYFGKANRELFEKINKADTHELVTQKRVYTQLENITKYIKKESKEITKKQYIIDGTKITKEEAMAVYANSLNPNNRIRLTEGYGWSDEKIDKIIDLLSPAKNKGKDLRKLTNRYMQLINSLWPETSEVLRKLTGERMGKVENYWPIKSDFELSKRAKLRMAEKDLFQDIMEQVYIRKGFTKERIGGKEAVDLQFFRVLTNHIDGVIHFNSFAVPVRDVQKLLHHPLVESALKTSIGEHKYKQGIDWLKDVANPRRTPLDRTDRIMKYLRTRSVMAMLGIKVSVSLKQAGSIFQTINRIGVKDTLNGLRVFYKNPRKAVRGIFEMSPFMENRSKSFDRELKNMLDEQEVRLFGKDMRMKNVAFWMIRSIDQLTTNPSWLGAYNKQMRLSKNNIDKSIEYGDAIARRTQPTARTLNLANIQRGNEFRKIFVPFYTHFSNVYNELTRTTKRFKYGDIGIPEAVMSYTYLLIMPAIYSMIVSRLAFTVKDELDDVDWKATMARMAKEVTTYGAASVPILGSLVNSVLSGFEFRPIPALEGIREIAKFGQSIKKGILKTAEYEDIEGLLEELPKIAKHGIKGGGYITGFPTPQIMLSYEGAMDLIHGETEDWRRLILSKYALREK